MLEINGLCVNYGPLRIIRDVAMSVADGEIAALIGANGAGKTSLVRALSGLSRPTDGKIVFDGADITEASADRRVEAGIIQVPEGRKLYSAMSVRENLEMGAYCRRAREKEKENLAYVYSIFPGLESMERKPCGNLSGGQQQMVAIGRGIMAYPRLLILDEPSVGLSPVATQAMFEAIRKINADGISVLITEQNVRDVLKMASAAFVMQQGQIVMSGSAEDIARDEELKKVYLGM